MKKIINAALLFTFTMMIASCGNGKKQKEGALGDKKVELQKLKEQQSGLDEKITALENEIAKLDTSASVEQKERLVAISAIGKQDFRHYLEVQGKVDAHNISYITPAGQGGQIKQVLVKQGDQVRKGQLILKLDNAVSLQNENAVRQQMNGVKAQLGLAKSVYERQKNL